MKPIAKINGFPQYLITVTGRVLSLKRYGGYCRVLKQNTCGKTGYKYVTLMKDKKAVTKRVHRLVAETFLKKPQKGMIVNHIDGDKANNKLHNLEWVTYSQNSIHSYKNGLQHVGEKHPQSKFSDADISKVFELRSMGWTQVEIGKSLNMSQPHVSAVLRGKLRNYEL